MKVRSPKRTRGERTLERLVAAAAALLERKTLEAVSIADIAREAGTAVGTFYTWFGAKEDLLPHLYARYDEEVGREANEVLAPGRFRDEPLEGRAAILVSFLVRVYRRRRGLYRAALLHAATRPEAVEDGARKRRRQLLDRAAALLAGERGSPEEVPRDAADFALALAMSSLKDRILLEEASRGIVRPLSDPKLASELERAVVAYLRSAADRRR